MMPDDLAQKLQKDRDGTLTSSEYFCPGNSPTADIDQQRWVSFSHLNEAGEGSPQRFRDRMKMGSLSVRAWPDAHLEKILKPKKFLKGKVVNREAFMDDREDLNERSAFVNNVNMSFAREFVVYPYSGPMSRAQHAAGVHVRLPTEEKYLPEMGTSYFGAKTNRHVSDIMYESSFGPEYLLDVFVPRAYVKPLGFLFSKDDRQLYGLTSAAKCCSYGIFEGYLFGAMAAQLESVHWPTHWVSSPLLAERRRSSGFHII